MTARLLKNPSTAGSRIFVGHLQTDDTNKGELEEHFSKYGTVVGSLINRGFGFVQFDNDEAARNAIQKENGAIFKGRRIDVRPVKKETFVPGSGPQGMGGLGMSGNFSMGGGGGIGGGSDICGMGMGGGPGMGIGGPGMGGPGMGGPGMGGPGMGGPGMGGPGMGGPGMGGPGMGGPGMGGPGMGGPGMGGPGMGGSGMGGSGMGGPGMGGSGMGGPGMGGSGMGGPGMGLGLGPGPGMCGPGIGGPGMGGRPMGGLNPFGNNQFAPQNNAFGGGNQNFDRGNNPNFGGGGPNQMFNPGDNMQGGNSNNRDGGNDSFIDDDIQEIDNDNDSPFGGKDQFNNGNSNRGGNNPFGGNQNRGNDSFGGGGGDGGGGPGNNNQNRNNQFSPNNQNRPGPNQNRNQNNQSGNQNQNANQNTPAGQTNARPRGTRGGRNRNKNRENQAGGKNNFRDRSPINRGGRGSNDDKGGRDWDRQGRDRNFGRDSFNDGRFDDSKNSSGGPGFGSNASADGQSAIDKNDCEIIVVNKIVTEYAEMIEMRLKKMGLSVDLLFPNEDVPLSRVLGNIASRGCLYALVIAPVNMEHRSLTLNILHGLPQEHRNMPVDDAITLMNRDFANYKNGGRSVPLNTPFSNERHPDPIQVLVNMLADNHQLTVLQYDRIIKYLEMKREEQIQIELGDAKDISGPNTVGINDPKQAELQSRILNILNSNKPSGNAPVPSPVPAPVSVPPTTWAIAPTSNVASSTSGKATGVSPSPLLNDPTVQKALDSLLQGNLLKSIGEPQSAPAPSPLFAAFPYINRF